METFSNSIKNFRTIIGNALLYDFGDVSARKKLTERVLPFMIDNDSWSVWNARQTIEIVVGKKNLVGQNYY